jgi:hypothetical protein
MRVKGTAVKATPKFVQEKFGDSGFKLWIDALSPEAKKIYTDTILINSWYPMHAAYIDPHQAIINLFYGGDKMGLWELGRYAADFGLRGIYKVFVRIGSPYFLIKKTGRVFKTFYDPGEALVTVDEKGKAAMRIVDFPERTGLVETRIAGWIERALQISGCKDLYVSIPSSLTKGDSFIEISASWQDD